MSLNPQAVALRAALQLRRYSPECASELTVADAILAWLLTDAADLEARCAAVHLAVERISGGSNVSGFLELATRCAHFLRGSDTAPSEDT